MGIEQKLYNYSKSIFVRNILKLASGTAFGQIISVITAPVLYRIYEKEDYGILGLFIALSGSIGAFSTMQYSQAIILEKEDYKATQVIWLIRLINSSLSILVFLLILSKSHWIADQLNSPGISCWLLLLPISLFFSGHNETYRIWANRKKEFSIMTINSILTSILVPLVSIGFGVFNKSPNGLFLGLLTSQIAPALFLRWQLKKKRSLIIGPINWNEIVFLAKKHYALPFYSLPSDFINRLSNQLPIFMLSTYSGASSVGVYNLSIRMLGLPIQLLSGAIGEVFRQKASEDYFLLGNCKTIFLKTLKTLVALSIFPLLITVIWGPSLFSSVFGEKWLEAGEYSQILSVMFFFRFFTSPLSFLFFIAGKQKQDFYWHILMGIFSFISFYIGFQVFKSAKISLFLFSIGYSLIYIIYLIKSYQYSAGEKSN